MKFTEEITINQPLSHVVELAGNPDNLKYWQPDLISYIPIEGTPGQQGAKAKLIYSFNGRELEMIETITVRNLPDEMTAVYETKGMVNTITIRFVGESVNTTKMITESEFKFSGLMKILGTLMFGQLRKQSQIYLQNFKNFAETGASAQKSTS